MISAERIPNNVGLSSNKRLQRALEHWQPKYIQWWKDMGPQGFQDYHQVYVRTAVSVDPSGWAHFEYVKLPEYRWGIFLADPVHDRRIGFGDFLGQPVWQEVPGEFRNQLRRLIVTQGDTEPASSIDPRSRRTRFMLTEEAHHRFVGETGIARIIERTCQLLGSAGYSEDVRRLGGIDLPTMQKFINLWFSLSLDLHGNEIATNAASYFGNGLKGRAQEEEWAE